MFQWGRSVLSTIRTDGSFRAPRVISLFSAALLLCAAQTAHATTYYVDSVYGSDTSSGTSSSTPWKTLAKVNSTTFSHGDSILFRAGETWAGQLHPLGNGWAGSPITISSYSTGAMPIIDGGLLSGGGAVYLSNQSYWTITGLEVVSDSGVDNFGTATTPGVNRSGIFVDNEGGGSVSGITIQYNYVHDVNGCFYCNGYDAHVNGGIVVVADGANELGLFGLSLDGYNGVNISHNTVSHVGRTGITFYDNSSGVLLALVPFELSAGVTIQANSVSTIDSDGIIVSGTDGTLIDHNVVANAGQKTIAPPPDNPQAPGAQEPSSIGIWPTRSENTTIQYNEVYGTLTHTTDGQGFDVDGVCTNTIIQYNYSHDNQGGFLIMEDVLSSSSTIIARYNLSVNDGYGGVKGVFTFGDSGVVDGTSIYNNTIYIAAGLPSQPIYCDLCATPLPSGNWSFKNNIIANFGSGNYVAPGLSGGGVITNNIFYGNHPASEPADPNKITSDPQFVSASSTAPVGLASVAGYQVSNTSPAVGSGIVITSNGGHDYFGRPVSATANPTRGFFEEHPF
jgi:hypothetical protein